jgi:hypothetical protein
MIKVKREAKQIQKLLKKTGSTPTASYIDLKTTIKTLKRDRKSDKRWNKSH